MMMVNLCNQTDKTRLVSVGMRGEERNDCSISLLREWKRHGKKIAEYMYEQNHNPQWEKERERTEEEKNNLAHFMEWSSRWEKWMRIRRPSIRLLGFFTSIQIHRYVSSYCPVESFSMFCICLDLRRHSVDATDRYQSLSACFELNPIHLSVPKASKEHFDLQTITTERHTSSFRFILWSFVVAVVRFSSWRDAYSFVWSSTSRRRDRWLGSIGIQYAVYLDHSDCYCFLLHHFLRLPSCFRIRLDVRCSYDCSIVVELAVPERRESDVQQRNNGDRTAWKVSERVSSFLDPCLQNAYRRTRMSFDILTVLEERKWIWWSIDRTREGEGEKMLYQGSRNYRFLQERMKNQSSTREEHIRLTLIFASRSCSSSSRASFSLSWASWAFWSANRRACSISIT